jgi:preprotein translocase subunit SecG
MQNNFSQTQIANFSTMAALLLMILARFGVAASMEQVTFILGAVWAVGSTIYNFIQRYQRGDITLGGFKK